MVADGRVTRERLHGLEPVASHIDDDTPSGRITRTRRASRASPPSRPQPSRRRCPRCGQEADAVDISPSLTAATAPLVRRTTSRAYQPSAGLPMASDLAIPDGFDWPYVVGVLVKGCRARREPVPGRPRPHLGAVLDEAKLGELSKPFVDLGQRASRRDGDTTAEAPAELLGNLEGKRLGALGE